MTYSVPHSPALGVTVCIASLFSPPSHLLLYIIQNTWAQFPLALQYQVLPDTSVWKLSPLLPSQPATHIHAYSISWRSIIVCFSLSISGLGSHSQPDPYHLWRSSQVYMYPLFPLSHTCALVFGYWSALDFTPTKEGTACHQCLTHTEWSGWTAEFLGGLLSFTCERLHLF